MKQKIINQLIEIIKDEEIKKELTNSDKIKEVIEKSNMIILLDKLFHGINGVIDKDELESYTDNELLKKVLYEYINIKEITILEEIEEEVSEEIEKDEFDDYFEEDATKAYLRLIRKKPLLTKDEEVRLIKLKESGNEEAKKKLIEHNLRLVVSIAKRYIGRGEQLLDLVQYGNLGLIKAVDKLNSSYNCKLSTYATWWIRQSIEAELKNNSRLIRLPVYIEDDHNKLKKAEARLESILNRDPTIEELSMETGFSIKKIKQLRNWVYTPVSLDKLVEKDEESTLEDFIASDSYLLLEEEVMGGQLKLNVESILKCLTKREKKIIMMRSGIETGKEMTLEEVAQVFNITRERVRQIEAKALKKLRHPRNTRKVKEFLE